MVVQIKVGLSQSISPSTFTAPGAFPTSVYEKYFNSPTATSAQVQPVISDPVTVASHSLPWCTYFNDFTQFLAQSFPIVTHGPRPDPTQ